VNYNLSAEDAAICAIMKVMSIVAIRVGNGIGVLKSIPGPPALRLLISSSIKKLWIYLRDTIPVDNMV